MGYQFSVTIGAGKRQAPCFYNIKFADAVVFDFLREMSDVPSHASLPGAEGTSRTIKAGYYIWYTCTIN